ncbi:MAG: polysaccharide deacetylase family protein [Gemmatimonadaceae bacterium]
MRLTFGILLACLASTATCQSPTLAERLGYPRDAKLLIVNADDLGMTRSVNAASIKALNDGAIRSASVMIPAPHIDSIASYARANPDADLGLHLTLTAEWPAYKWSTVLPRDSVPSLFDGTGHLYTSVADAVAHIDPRDAAAELRAQIERARTMGIRPTHLDSHMGVLYGSRELLDALLRVSRETGLPARVARESVAQIPFLADLIRPDDVLIDRRVTIDPAVTPEQWTEFYATTIRNLKPGVTEMIVHLGYDDEEMRAATSGQEDWGAAWRQRDFDFFTSDRFRHLLRENGVTLIVWKDIARLTERSR